MSVRPVVVVVSGERWDEVAGTSRRMALALSETVDVLWVEPPHSFLTSHRPASVVGRPGRAGAPTLRRTTVPMLPGWSRPMMQPLTRLAMSIRIRTALRGRRSGRIVTLLTSPSQRFPALGPTTRVLYVVDDWMAGADLLRLGGTTVRRTVSRNLAAADVVVAVSPQVARSLESLDPTATVHVVPNGCSPVDRVPGEEDAARRPRAALVGTLNDRLDFDILEALVDAGIPITVVGPRADRDPAVSVRLDRLLAAPGVTWLGFLPADRLPGLLASATVGITPYADTAFNRGSFPLKTLEYLASGLRVVATPLPAVEWLATDLIRTASSPRDFLDEVGDALSTPLGPAESDDRRAFAETHSWSSRASDILESAGFGRGRAPGQ